MNRITQTPGRARQSAFDDKTREVFEALESAAASLDLTRTADAVLASKVDSALGVLKIVTFERICSPVAQAAEVKLGANVLQ